MNLLFLWAYPGGVWLQWLLDFFVQGDKASFEGGDDCLGAGVGIQFTQYGGYVVFDGLFTDVELERDLLVEETLGHIVEDFSFPGGER